MIQRAFLIHALSPLHPGTGQALGHIDLPIARYKATGIPYLPGSSIKGVLRDALEPTEIGAPFELHRAVFGPDHSKGEPAAEHAGAVVFGDARLLLLPVRSLRGTFAYATCPLLLRLARPDFRAGREDVALPPIPVMAPADRKALVAQGSALLEEKGYVFFEDIERTATPDKAGVEAPVAAWGQWLGELLFPGEASVLTQRLTIVDDETMTFFWETCTQVDTRVRLNDQGVVEDGALWSEENLPAETVLVGLAAASIPFRKDVKKTPTELLDHCLGRERSNLQFGGKATIGRGRARLVPGGAR